MKLFKYIVKNINLLNVSLVIAIIFLAQYTVLPVLDANTKFPQPKTKEAVTKEVKNPPEEQTPPLSEFIVVAERNLFHPDRIIPVENITSEPDSPTEIVLYGTLITDSDSYAYVEDKKSSYTTPGRGKRQLVLRKGSTIGGYTLTDINNDSIILVKGEDKLTVTLMDSRKQNNKEKSDTAGILPNFNPIENATGPDHPQNEQSPNEMPTTQTKTFPGRKYPVGIPHSAPGVKTTPNSAAKNTMPPYISPRTRAKILQMGSNNSQSAP